MALMHEPTTLPADQDFATVQGGVAYLNEIERRLGAYFARTEPR